MRVVTPKAIHTYAAAHPDAATSLDLWLQTTKRATWQNLAEVRNDFRHADLLGRRTIFNIAGNKYRMITRINYQRQIVYVLHILTHGEYDKGAWK
jgi:mRNA interferase HigB